MKNTTVLRVLVLISIIAFGAFIVPSLVVEPVNAVVNNDIWYSRPAGYRFSGFVVGTTLVNPTRAYDTPTSPPLGNDTWASINYGGAVAGSTFTVGNETGAAARAFKIPTIRELGGLPNPKIQKVDIVMTWGANASSGTRNYAFRVSVGLGAWTTFLGPQNTAQAKTTQTWSYTTKPGGGAWSWTDINQVRIQVLTGASGSATWMSVYDIKLNVYIGSSPRLFVSPSNITDTSKVVGSTFTVYVELQNVSLSAGTDFKLRYDPSILNVTTTVPTPPLSPAEDQALPADFIYATGTIWEYSVDRVHGIVHISYTAGPLATIPPPTVGSGKVMQLDFKVLGLGGTTLKLYDSVQGRPGGGTIPCELTNGYFRNIGMPYGATFKALVEGAQPKSEPFIVDINITKSVGQSGAFGIYSYEFNMTYNTSHLSATDANPGTFLSVMGPLAFTKTINDVKGWVFINGTLSGDYPGARGNGTLAKIEFDIMSGAGAGVVTSLHFVSGKLTRQDYGLPAFYPFSTTTVDGSVNVKYAPHDVAVTAANSEATLAYKGLSRKIKATLTNQGSWTETFYVTASYNSSKLDVEGYSYPMPWAPVNGYVPDAGWETTPWTKTGVSPYLSTANYPTDYVSTSTTNAKIGYFTFADVSSQSTMLLSVRIYLKTWQTLYPSANDTIEVYVSYDGTNWSGNYTLRPTAAASPPGTSTPYVDVSDYIDTWAKVNATRMRIKKLTSGVADTIGIDYAYIAVNDIAGAEISGWTKTGSPPYLSAADYATNYISALTTGAKTGDFSFPNATTYGQTLIGAKLYLKTWSGVDDEISVSLFDAFASPPNFGTPYLVHPTSHVAPGSYIIVDIFDQMNTWAKINATRMRIQKVTLNSEDTVGVDHAYIVTYCQIGTTETITDLPAGNSQDVTFTWDTTNVPYGIYEVNVTATVVPGEKDLADNERKISSGVVMMTIQGDVNGDKTVNVFDILAVKSRWGRTPASPDWIPEYDANVDGAINVFDILLIKANWGESW